MMKRSLTPQEKKLLSYAKDGRNTVAESRRIAHKAIARRKSKANRALRRAQSQVLATAPAPDADVFIARSGRRSWRKLPDAPLGEYVAARLGVRESIGMNRPHVAGPLLRAGRKRAKVRKFWLMGSLHARGVDTVRA
jgi:hypothetical protein